MATLSAGELRRLKPERVALELGEILEEAWTELAYVYFPKDALVSVIAVAHGGKGLEIGMIGGQGLTGAFLALGISTSPSRLLVQGRGTAYRVKAKAFSRELDRNADLRRAVSRRAFASHVVAGQVAACNNAHGIAQRCARWLLMTSDTLASTSFFLTQEFLAQMLGVRRPSVSEVATELQKLGLVTYSRGNFEILNRAALVRAACGCYPLIQSASRN